MLEETARNTHRSDIARLDENHWGAIAKLNLYNMEKQHLKELNKAKGDKEFIKTELDVQIKERRGERKVEKRAEREEEQEENRRTVANEALEETKVMEKLVAQRRRFKNNLD